MIKKVLLILLILLLSCSVGFADKVYLKNGKVVQGEILEETSYLIKIKVNSMPFTYFINEIEKVEKEDPQPNHVELILGEPSEEKKELVRRFLDANGARNNMVQIFNQLMSEVPSEKKQELSQMLKVDIIIERLIPIYAKYYTEEELKELIIFFKSSAGMRHLEVMPKILQESLVEVADYFQEKSL